MASISEIRRQQQAKAAKAKEKPKPEPKSKETPAEQRRKKKSFGLTKKLDRDDEAPDPRLSRKDDGKRGHDQEAKETAKKRVLVSTERGDMIPMLHPDPEDPKGKDWHLALTAFETELGMMKDPEKDGHWWMVVAREDGQGGTMVLAGPFLDQGLVDPMIPSVTVRESLDKENAEVMTANVMILRLPIRYYPRPNNPF